MYTLAINTATSKSAICILSENNGVFEVVDSKSWDKMNSESEFIMPSISQIVDEQNIDFKDINKVICLNGPGSFTGLRVGVNVANTITYINKSDLFTLSTFDYLWNVANASFDCKDAVCLVFAGKGAVYIDKNDQSIPSTININELQQELDINNVKAVFGDITDEQKSLLTNTQFKNLNDDFSINICNILNAYSKNNTLNNLKTTLAVPNYIKGPNISISKKNILS